MTEKEKIFKDKYDNKEFKFSYSSMNRLRFSPKLFYKDYILKDREVRMDKHLIEGRLLHLLLLQPENFDQEFILTPSKLPSDTLRKVIMNIMLYTDAEELSAVDDKIILDSLKEVGLYQSLKDESKRVAKVRTTECEDFYIFSQTIDIKTSGKSIVNFAETVEYYNYWMQAAVYTMLVLKNVPDGIQGYKINFNFIVVDTYNQVYNFGVREETMQTWGKELMKILKACKYHLDEMSFDLPYEFINNKVML